MCNIFEQNVNIKKRGYIKMPLLNFNAEIYPYT